MARIVAIEHTGFTSLGTGTSKTLLGGANLILPAWAKNVLAVMPAAAVTKPTATEGYLISAEVESDDVAINPFQVLCAPIQATLGTTVGSAVAKVEKYAIGCPVSGGEQLRIYETQLVDPTLAGFGGAAVVISNEGAGHPQRHAKIGTATSTGTTASSDVAGTRYNFSGARRIIELMAAATQTTVDAEKMLFSMMKYTSNEFLQSVPLKLPMNPINGQLATTNVGFIDGVSRAQVEVPVSSGQVNIQDYFYMASAITNAGNFISGVIYD